MMAGLIGTSANIGVFVTSRLGTIREVTPDSWRWLMLVTALPAVLGLFALWRVPESPAWLATR